MDFPFIGPAYMHRSVNVAAQRCVNLFPEVVEVQNEKLHLVLIGAPGKSLFELLPKAPLRGSWLASNGRAFAVAGNSLYEVYADGTYLERGALLTSSGRVSIADNGLQMMLVDGSHGYILTLATNIYAQITDPDFPGADTVGFLDGYFVFNIPNTGMFGITALYDGFDVNALDIATAEGSPDLLIGLLIDHREVWLFGSQTTEVFFNSGNASFPIERIQGAFMEHGCAAKGSPAKLDNSVFWLGQDDKGRGMVFRATNYQPTRISTHAIEHAINQYADISDAASYTYQEEGHSFYVLNFPTGDATWVYDAATQMWHERAYLNVDGTLSRDRADNHMFAFGKHLLGDHITSALYEASLDIYADYDRPLKAIRSAPHYTKDRNGVFYPVFELGLETGVGLDGIQQGDDPVAMLRWSNDGGHTWGNYKNRAIGRIGAFAQRLRWNRLGWSRDRVFEVSITDPIKRVLLWANAKTEVQES